MSKAKLTYFAGWGRAEVIRLILAAAGIEWEEEHLSDKERVAEIRKDGLMFEQFPSLEIDGMQLVQSMSILRYLASKHGFMGKTPEENVQINMLTDGARDMIMLGFLSLMFNPKDKRDDMKAALLEKSKKRYLPAFEKVLKENNTGFLVGNTLTMADIALLDSLTWVWEWDEPLVYEFPGVKTFYDKVTSLPRIQEYLKGPQRFPQPDEDYVKQVKAALYS